MESAKVTQPTSSDASGDPSGDLSSDIQSDVQSDVDGDMHNDTHSNANSGLPKDLADTVKHALREDIGSGDLTAGLVPEDAQSVAKVMVREPAVICGIAWFNEVFKQLNSDIQLDWHVADGDRVDTDQVLVTLTGNTRALLAGERTALNFLQTLSGTATLADKYHMRVRDTKTQLRDTRKTIPGLRTAQKYAIKVAGLLNHRVGLYDAVLIKENHIQAVGSLAETVKLSREQVPEGTSVEVEVETLEELEAALKARADVILADNFPLPQLRKACNRVKEFRLRHDDVTVKIEASGGVSWEKVRDIADTGVDYIAIGALTKDVTAIDLSMRFQD